MNKETRKALLGSIQKWEKIRDMKDTDKGRKNCPLCGMFIGAGCYGCPVSIKAGISNCRSTPYEEWACSEKKYKKDESISKIGKRLAQSEVDFLRSLLP